MVLPAFHGLDPPRTSTLLKRPSLIPHAFAGRPYLGGHLLGPARSKARGRSSRRWHSSRARPSLRFSERRVFRRNVDLGVGRQLCADWVARLEGQPGGEKSTGRAWEQTAPAAALSGWRRCPRSCRTLVTFPHARVHDLRHLRLGRGRSDKRAAAAVIPLGLDGVLEHLDCRRRPRFCGIEERSGYTSMGTFADT